VQAIAALEELLACWPPGPARLARSHQMAVR
jgi:hypothetical protein